MIILLLVFLGSVGMIGTILYQYHKIDQLHEAAVVQYTKTQERHVRLRLSRWPLARLWTRQRR